MNAVPKLKTTAHLLAALALLGLAANAHADICRVTTTGTTTADGSSWDQAMGLHTALASIECTEIWVAGGTFLTTTTTDPSVSFTIARNLEIYGGFAGTETALGQRVPGTNPTILSGDIPEVDGNHAPNNSYHVVYVDGRSAGPITAATILDGVEITGGSAVSGSYRSLNNYGGGLYCDGEGTGSDCSPTLTNVAFRENSARWGGAMCNFGFGDGNSSPTLTNVTFSGNAALVSGGGMFNEGSDHGNSSPTLTDVVFSENISYTGDGGGMYNRSVVGGTSNPALTNVTFSGNAAVDGGGMYSVATMDALTSTEGTASPTLVNVTFSGNSVAEAGGGMFNFAGAGGNASPTLTYVTFNDNWAGEIGGAMFSGTQGPDGDSNPTIANSIFWGNRADDGGNESTGQGVYFASIRNSIVEGGCPHPAHTQCENVSSEDPLLGPLQDNGGFTPTHLPAGGGSAIDIHYDVTCVATDQRGVTRPQGPVCDIGAVEVEQMALSVAVSGRGQVDAAASPTPVVGGIAACTAAGGANCSAVYGSGDIVILTAAPAAGWVFGGWSGDCAGNNTSATITLSAESSCSATFVAIPALDISPAAVDFGVRVIGDTSAAQVVTLGNPGTGSLEVSGLTAADAPFAAAGDSCGGVPFIVAPGGSCTLGYSFGPTAVGAASLAITVTSNAPGGDASFTLRGTGRLPDPYGLTVAVSGAGQVDAGASPAPRGGGVVACTATGGTNCAAGYSPGDVVSLAATPAAGWAFDGWSGDCAGGVSGATVTMDAERVCSAVFVELDREYTSPLPSGTTGRIAFTTADPRCAFASEPAFIPADDSRPAPPAGLELVDGLAVFTIGGCAPGASVTLTVDYGVELSPGVEVWKVADPWRPLDTMVAGSTVRYTLTDGGPNDDDGVIDGSIVDPAGAGQVALAAPAVPVPVDARWALWLLALLVGVAAARQTRRRA